MLLRSVAFQILLKSPELWFMLSAVADNDTTGFTHCHYHLYLLIVASNSA